MKPLPPSSSSIRRGSALITVLLFTFMLVTLVASIMQWSLSERRLNIRSSCWLEARNAAEAVAEYGCYQVAQAFNQQMYPTFGGNGTANITFPSSVASSFFSGSNVDTSSVAITVGGVTKIPSSGLYYINPLDKNNTYDPMVGRYVYRRDVIVLTKATVNPPAGGGPPVTSYIEETVSVRGAPLFAYAIFYSGNDLEFGETPLMDIYGPVHVNGNLFVTPSGPSGSTPSALTFHGPVTASGDVYHAWRGTTGTAQEGSSIMSQSVAVNFATDTSSTGNPVSMRNASSVWDDSTMGADYILSGTNAGQQNGLALLQSLVTPAVSAQFSQYASQTWHGNLQTGAMGIMPYNPMGFTEPVAVDSSSNPILANSSSADDAATVGTTAATEPNSATALGTGYGHGYGPHSLIEPPMTLPATSDPYYTAKTAIEQQKFSNKAGLYVQVNAANGNIVLYGDPNSAPAGTPTTSLGPNGGIQLGTAPAKVFQYIPYTTNATNNTVKTGLYDQHQSAGVNLLQIDMGALKTALTDMMANTTTSGGDIVASNNSTKWGSSSTPYDQYTPGSTGWNGGVYVEVKGSSGSNETAVVLSNGVVASGNSLIPNANGINGLTVATNAPVYILGSFNADGTVTPANSTYTSAAYPDDAASGTAPINSKQIPVAIAGDAVTLLSSGYFGSGNVISTNTTTTVATANTMSSGSAYNSYNSLAPHASGSVEVAAAIISGTVPTSPDSTGTQQYSGGVHNFPRFLENWSNTAGTVQYTVAVRGSMVCMYNSRIATAGWRQAYYNAPVRLWGYDQIFAAGRFPPICPTVLSYRRVDFTYIKNSGAYTAELNSLTGTAGM